MRSLHVLMFLWMIVISRTTEECCDENTIKGVLERLESSENMVTALWKELKRTQLYVEEQKRSDGNSGLKRTRGNSIGTRSFFTESHTLRSAMSMHDHSNYNNTVGLGEFVAVLNGVEFRTRHNDYKLMKPAPAQPGVWGKLDNIEAPEVPPAVLEKPTVAEQIEEMRAWFKAFHMGYTPETTARDYRPYFKPVVCYLEACWTVPTNKIDEPFPSDRHQIDASSWHDLNEKVEFTSYTGRKSNLENFSYLPTRIMHMLNGTLPVLAQWNYRIVCQPLDKMKKWLSPTRFTQMDDLGARMAFKESMEEYGVRRGARFMVKSTATAKDLDTFYVDGLLDEIMGQVPGRDGAGAVLDDDAFGEMAYPVSSVTNDKKLNTNMYSRFYKVLSKDAMGLSKRNRGFSDSSIFMAQTSDPKVASMSVDVCKGNGKKKRCEKWTQRWTYAIPLEIIYLTPLTKWNPYNILYKGTFKTPEGKTVAKDGRNGGMNLLKAWNGTNSKTYYQTPDHFFSGREASGDPADTVRGAGGVLNSTGHLCAVRATGIRVFLPKIEGVGTIRQRYPIFPVHMEGKSEYKECEALKMIVMKQNTYRDMLIEKRGSNSGDPGKEGNEKTMNMMTSTTFTPVEHTHTFSMTQEQVNATKSGKKVDVTTDEAAGHTHDLKIRYNGEWGTWYYLTCGGKDRCWDKHPKQLIPA